MKKTFLLLCLALVPLFIACNNQAEEAGDTSAFDTLLVKSDNPIIQAELDTLRARNARMEQELDECNTALDDAGYNFYQIGRYLDSAITALDHGNAVEAKSILKEAKDYWSNPVYQDNKK